MRRRELYQTPKVHIAYYDSECDVPSYDDSIYCPLCGHSLVGTTRDVAAIMIHCTRWPLATYVRFHKDELPQVGEIRYHEIVVEALSERDRIETERKSLIPSVFKSAFVND